MGILKPCFDKTTKGYEAAAMLLGMSYSSGLHAFYHKGNAIKLLDADTLELLWEVDNENDPDDLKWRKVCDERIEKFKDYLRR